MTIDDLIARLSRHDDDMPVRFVDRDGNEYELINIELSLHRDSIDIEIDNT